MPIMTTKVFRKMAAEKIAEHDEAWEGHDRSQFIISCSACAGGDFDPSQEPTPTHVHYSLEREAMLIQCAKCEEVLMVVKVADHPTNWGEYANN